MKADAPPVLVARTETDVIHAIPSLLGFRPRDSIVVLVVTPLDGVILTARVDLATCQQLVDPSEPLAGALLRLGGRPGLGVIVVGFGNDRDEVGVAVGSMLRAIHVPAVFGAVVVGGRWWYDDDGRADPGRRYDPRSSAIEAASVYAGQQVLPSREDVVASLDPVGGRRPRGVTRAFAQAQQRVNQLAPARLGRIMARILDESEQAASVGASAPRPLDECALLATLARHPVAREEYWQRLSRGSSAVYVGVWREVVRVTPKRWSVAPLCLLGMAAWQAGEGVLLSTSLDRAMQISGRHELVKVLAAVSFNMLPPYLWNEIRGARAEVAA